MFTKKYVAKVNIGYPSDTFIVLHKSESKSELHSAIQNWLNANYAGLWNVPLGWPSYGDTYDLTAEGKTRHGRSIYNIAHIGTYKPTDQELLQDEIESLSELIEKKRESLRELQNVDDEDDDLDDEDDDLDDDSDDEDDDDTLAANDPIYAQKIGGTYPKTGCTCDVCVKKRKEFDEKCGAIYYCDCSSCADNRKRYSNV